MNFGRYEVIDRIGKGAMGVVYRCLDPQIGRTVAIKTLALHPSSGFEESELRERLTKEARAAGILSHPHIVTIFDVGEDEDSVFIVMEYLEGTPLSDALKAEGAAFSIEDVLLLVDQIGGALDYAHSEGIVHRDVKPANIMRLSNNRMKLMDFGIASVFEAGAVQTGSLIGSPVYMAPEQIDGAELDGRADVYALGAVVFEMLTGKRPFRGGNVNALILAKFENRRRPLSQLNPKLPAALEQFFDRAMSPMVDARFASAEELSRQLRTCLFSHPGGFSPAPGGYASETPHPSPGMAPLEDDPSLAETVMMDDLPFDQDAVDGIGVSDAEDTTNQAGISTSAIRAYTTSTGPGAAVRGEATDKPDEPSDTGVIRRNVEKELGELAESEEEALDSKKLAATGLREQLEDIRTRLEKNASDVDAIIALGSLYQRAGRYSEAIVQYRRALRFEYERTDALDGIASIYQHLNMEARAYRTWGLSESLRKRRVGRLAQSEFFELGLQLEQERLLRGAIEVWEELAVLEPSNVDVWHRLAHYYLKMRDFARAVKAHRILVGLNPKDAVSQRNLAACLQNEGHYREALQEWRRSMKIDSQSAGARKARKQIEALQRYLGENA